MPRERHSDSRTGDDGAPLSTRRAALAALGGVTAASVSGCVQQVESVVARDASEQISLSIKTVPADADPRAVRIARFLVDNLDRVGVEATVVPTSREVLFRDVLLNHDFDLYVARSPGNHDPDFLRTLLHSRFATEVGWQNPFGYTNLSLDEQLEDQRRRHGNRRRDALDDVQHTVVRDQPFAVVGFPDEIRANRTDRIAGWTRAEIHTPLGYLTLSPVGGSDGDDVGHGPVRMTLTDARPTKNLNPLSVEFRTRHPITDLLYDPLARRVDGTLAPWLAASWTWVDDAAAEGPVADVTLRDGLEWHDGRPLSVVDVAFTYRFLADASDGSLDSPVPSPRHRGPVSLIESVEPYRTGLTGDSHGVDTPADRTVRFRFRPASRTVARRAFTVPLLPEHVWRKRTSPASVAGLDASDGVPEAFVWNNSHPVGSGPLRFESANPGTGLTLAPAENHFLHRSDLDGALQPFAGGFSFERLSFVVVPSGAAAAELIAEGSADATASGVASSVVPRIGRSDALDLDVARSSSFYHVGFNVRQAPLSNPRFRRAVARLLDREYLVDDVFGGYAEPAVTPLAQYSVVSPDLAWDGESPVLPFAGSNGELDVEAARRGFREAGYRYSDQGALLTG